MNSAGDGWFERFEPRAGAGSRYRFLLPDGSRVPDPASRYQPQDVDEPSEVIDPAAYTWQHLPWHGRPWAEAALYELHIGTFTPEGTFQAATAKLPHLAELGVTAIELMCLSDFPGNRSWGYDGVLLFAPDSAYGRPEDLKAFIDSAHGYGLMVILDVVFNHFGPEGNNLPRYFPQLLSQEHKTAWGAGLNFDGPGNAEVRDLIVQNGLYWIGEFHADGLRLDASHALGDNSPRHILHELAERLRAAAGDRSIHLILESENTIGSLLTRTPAATEEVYTAQWNHAIDHLLGAAMGGGCSAHAPEETHEIEEIGRALAQGFMAAELNCSPAEADVHVPPTAFVSFIQTHDLIGNRPFGDRIHSLAAPEAVRAIAAIYLLLPQVPMIFMGEEWAASTPFPFFCDFHGELAEAVRKGRCEEMSKSGQLSPEELHRVPDPGAEATFRSAQLRWDEVETEPHREQLAWYRGILAARQERIVPHLRKLVQACGSYKVLGPGTLTVSWTLGPGTSLHLAAHLCQTPSCPLPRAPGEVFWIEGSETPDGDETVRLGPWTARWSLERDESLSNKETKQTR